MAEWSGAAMEETDADRTAITSGRYVAGVPATPGAMEMRRAPSPPGPGTNANRSCRSIVRFVATSQPLTTILDTGQRRLGPHGDARVRQRVGVAAGGRIRYHRVLDFVGAERATNKFLCPTPIYVNHTSLLKR
jgi:hypothetical protein